MDDADMDLTELVERLRRRDIGQEYIARVLGRSQGTVSRYLSGERPMSALQREALEHLAAGRQPAEAQHLFPELYAGTLGPDPQYRTQVRRLKAIDPLAGTLVEELENLTRSQVRKLLAEARAMALLNASGVVPVGSQADDPEEPDVLAVERERRDGRSTARRTRLKSAMDGEIAEAAWAADDARDPGLLDLPDETRPSPS